MKKVVVIGAGLGGMSAAISLAKNKDYHVTIVEKNSHLGGKLNVLKKDGFSFDLGPSILTMPHIFEALFTMHNKQMDDYVKFEKVRPHWRNFFEDNTVIDLTANPDNMIKNKAFTKNDLLELKSFLAYAEKVYKFSDATYFKNQSETKLATLKYYNPFKIIKDADMFHTMDQGVRNHISNPYMIDILNFFIKYVGSSPYDAPAILNLLPYIQWKYDLWYVKGGMFNLSLGLEKLIKELDITVLTNKEVTNVVKEKHKINQLELNNQESIEADIIVSNMEVIPFYKYITKETAKFIKPYEEKYGPACSGFALHLGVDKVYETLAHHNFFFSKEPRQHFDKIFHEHTLTDDPTIYVVAPMKTDKTQGPKDHEIIKILPHIPVIDDDKPFTEKEYAKFKDHVLTKLERMGLKDLRKHIVSEELWTPETIRDTYYSNKGAIYGVVSDKDKNMGFKTPKHSKKYHNVYFVGGSTNPGGGMPMVVLSGQQVAKQIEKNKKL